MYYDFQFSVLGEFFSVRISGSLFLMPSLGILSFSLSCKIRMFLCYLIISCYTISYHIITPYELFCVPIRYRKGEEGV